jgi:dipeptidyl aminopeptidase/acylaminoacyl peptidase
MKYVIVFLLLGLAACADSKLALVNFPAHFDGAEVKHDIAYGATPEQKLDIYIPTHDPAQKLDVVVFIHGGRWTNGDKSDYKFLGTTLADRGYITVITDFRQYPQVKFPVFVQDNARALVWVSNHIAAYGGDPSRIHLTGHSSGAHIAALLTADKSYLRREGRGPIIYDFIGLAGPYAFTPDEPDLQDMFGPPKNYPAMQAPTFITGKQPPMLLLYGDADTDVKIYNLQKLRDKILSKHGCVKTIIYPGIDHIDLISALSWVGPHSAPVMQDMVDFMRAPVCDPIPH